MIVTLLVLAALLMEKTTGEDTAYTVSCSDVYLECPKSHPYVYNNTDGHTDESVCMGDSCPTCLKGPEWAALLAELGKGRVNRTLIPRMLIGDWLSTEIVHTIVTILLQDTMGFHVSNIFQLERSQRVDLLRAGSP